MQSTVPRAVRTLWRTNVVHNRAKFRRSTAVTVVLRLGHCISLRMWPSLDYYLFHILGTVIKPMSVVSVGKVNANRSLPGHRGTRFYFSVPWRIWRFPSSASSILGRTLLVHETVYKIKFTAYRVLKRRYLTPSYQCRAAESATVAAVSSHSGIAEMEEKIPLN